MTSVDQPPDLVVGPPAPGDGAARGRPSSGALTRAGYTTVFDEHRDAVFRVAMLLCGDHHRAEDATAEAFARVWVPWRAGRVLDERAYLCRAVVNELRSRGRRWTLEARTAQRRTAAPGRQSVEDAVVGRHVVLGALARLPDRQRAVVVLRFYEDLSEVQTADALGMRVGTVKSQTARGLARLRSLLADDLGGS